MQRRATYALAVLFLINAINFFDRQIIGAVAEPIRREWGLSDTELGVLATVFTLLYAVVGIPLGRLSDKSPRKLILAGGVFAWSLMTGLSGLARSFGQLVVARLGVGVGEATCSPAATSLLGDLYPTGKRARVMSVFMLGLPIGLGLSAVCSRRHTAGGRRSSSPACPASCARWRRSPLSNPSAERWRSTP
jgi:MFS family permease